MANQTPLFRTPIGIILLILAAVWIIALLRACGDAPPAGQGASQASPAVPIRGYLPLDELICPPRMADSVQEIAGQLLQQYFRVDTLSRDLEVNWRPDPKLDQIFFQDHNGPWTTYLECILELGNTPRGQEYIAFLVSNYPENDCHACAPVLGWIRFTMENNDPSRMILREANRYGFRFGAYGAIGDKISRITLGPGRYGLAFSSGYTSQGYTEGKTFIYDAEDLRLLLEVSDYLTNGGTTEEEIYTTEGKLYRAEQQPDSTGYYALALYAVTNRQKKEGDLSKETSTRYFAYDPAQQKYGEAPR